MLSVLFINQNDKNLTLKLVETPSRQNKCLNRNLYNNTFNNLAIHQPSDNKKLILTENDIILFLLDEGFQNSLFFNNAGFFPLQIQTDRLKKFGKLG